MRPGLWDWLLWVAVLCRIGQSSGIKKRLQENIGFASSAGINLGVQNSFFFFALSPGTICIHLPCICNSLELESVILHGICYIGQCLPSILHAICNVLALQPLICMVFATFWYFKRSCGFLESFFRLSFRVSFRVSFRASLGFLSGFI